MERTVAGGDGLRQFLSAMNRGALLRVGLWLLLMAGGLTLLWSAGWSLDGVFEALPSAAPGWFLAAMAVLPLIGFPIAIFYLYAGTAYGFLGGWMLCLLALALNLAASYVLGAYLLREPLKALLERRGHALPSWKSENQFRVTFLLRTIPGPPFWVQNYLLSAAGFRFGIYWPVSWLAQGVLAAGMVSLGHHTALPRTRVYLLVGLGLLSLLLLLRAAFRQKTSR